MAPRQHLSFDPAGDVLLVLTKNNTSRPKQKIEATVSSRHLTLASDVFRAMFNGNFRERISPGGGIKRVSLPDDDADAMVILLNIIHGLSRKVPKTIGLRTFVAIAILVDKYQLLETIDVYADRWFPTLWASAEYQTPVGLAKWIFLSWLFKKSFQFEMLTCWAIYKVDKVDWDHGLPIPETICSKPVRVLLI